MPAVVIKESTKVLKCTQDASFSPQIISRTPSESLMAAIHLYLWNSFLAQSLQIAEQI